MEKYILEYDADIEELIKNNEEYAILPIEYKDKLIPINGLFEIKPFHHPIYDMFIKKIDKNISYRDIYIIIKEDDIIKISHFFYSKVYNKKNEFRGGFHYQKGIFKELKFK